MDIRTLVLLLIPALGALIQVIVPRINKKASTIFPIFISYSMLIYSIIMAYYFAKGSSVIQFNYFIPWIPDWNINFRLALDGINLIGIIIASLICLVTVSFAASNKTNNLYYVILLIIQTLITAFFLSYDVVIKIVMWEMLWIPIFILISVNGKNKTALSFSKQWFFSEALLLTALIIIFNQYGSDLKVENIMSSTITGTKAQLIPFILMCFATFIRINLFPFDKITKNIIKTFEPQISILITVLVPIVPIFFTLTIMYPLFADLLANYVNYIAYITLIGVAVSLLRLFISKSINTITSSQILIFNSLIFIWTIKPNTMLIAGITEIIVVKALLNLAIIYFGYQIYKDKYKSSRIFIWMYSLPLVLSFGIPGLLMAKPMFLLLSSWYSKYPYISLTTILLLSGAFIYTSINIAPMFKNISENKISSKLPLTNVLLIASVILVATIISIYPYKVHQFSEAYYKYYTSEKVK